MAILTDTKISLYPSNKFTTNHNPNFNNTDISSGGEDWDSYSVSCKCRDFNSSRLTYSLCPVLTKSECRNKFCWKSQTWKFTEIWSHPDVQKRREDMTRLTVTFHPADMPTQNYYTEDLVNLQPWKSLNKILYDINTNYLHKCL